MVITNEKGRRCKMRWVRPVISLIGMVGLTSGFFLGMVTAEAYILAVGVTIAWWYRSRDEVKRNGQ